MLNFAFALTILLGVWWSSVGMVVTVARSKNCPIWSFYGSGAVMAVIILVSCGMWESSGLLNSGSSGILFLFAGAFLNALGQALTMYNLRGGAKALLFALPQMNFLVVFLLSVFFLQESTTLYSVAGIILLAGAVLGTGLLGANGRDNTLPGPRQLLLGISSALIVGLAQFAILLAGVSKSLSVSAGTKAVLVLAFSAFSYLCGAVTEIRQLRTAWKPTLKYGLIWGIFAALSYCTLFIAINAMNKFGRGGLVFAIGCSTAILTFWLFSVVKMHDRVSRKQAVLMLTIVLGVILLRI